uniref:HOOK N-terminal domain-containing protein n=1 Tax=Glossina brevipalpis TaxID=37001 RepID=A0A1A9X3B1_9MUSC
MEIKDLSGLPLAMARAKNFGCIVRNIKQLFEEDFGQTILLLPDCLTLRTKQGLEEMKLLLTLFLGAAVQCPNKEFFIGHIKELDVDTQRSLVELIKQVTVNHSLVLREESVEVLSAKDMYEHILRLTRGRANIYLRSASAACPESILNEATFSEKIQDTLNEPQEEYDKQTLERAVERSKILNLENQVESSSKKNERFQRLYESMQMRADHLEKIKGKTSGGYVHENARSLCKKLSKGKENLGENSVLLDKNSTEFYTLTRLMNSLVKSVDWNDLLQIRVTKLETINRSLRSQRDIDLQTISTLRNKLINETLAFNKVQHKLEELGLEFDYNADNNNQDLNVETIIAKFLHNPQTFNTARQIILNLSKQQEFLRHHPKVLNIMYDSAHPRKLSN